MIQLINGEEVEMTSDEVTELQEMRGNISEEIPSSVSARQFKMQLFNMNLYDTVNAYIKTQGVLTQIAYDNSSVFDKDDPMFRQGFTALGFTDAQIDSFYLEASKL